MLMLNSLLLGLLGLCNVSTSPLDICDKETLPTPARRIFQQRCVDTPRAHADVSDDRTTNEAVLDCHLRLASDEQVQAEWKGDAPYEGIVLGLQLRYRLIGCSRIWHQVSPVIQGNQHWPVQVFDA